MRFKTQLGLHPAWGRAVHVPAALLNHYRALGLDNNQLLYVLQIIAAYWRGEEANHSQIATIMGISERSLRNYNAALQEQGLASINGRYLHGNRLENDYDLTPMLDAASLLDQTNQQQQQQAEKNAYRIVQSLVNALETGDDVSGLLADLAREWREKTLTKDEPTGNGLPVETGNGLPVETGNGLPVETGNGLPVETGNGLPVETGNGLPVSTGNRLPIATTSSQPEASFRLKPEAGFRGLSVVPPNNDLLVETTTDNRLISQLEEIGFTNGDAGNAIMTAVEKFGDDGLTVVSDWLAYVATQDTIRNPAGLIRARIRQGERPPKLAAANSHSFDAHTLAAPEIREI